MRPGTVLLNDTLSQHAASLLFDEPREIVRAYTREEALTALDRLETARAEGLWAAGYFAYELGFVFEERLADRLPARSGTPLVWLGIFDAPQRLDARETDAWLAAHAGEGRAGNIVPRLSEAAYRRAFERCKDLIVAGDIYQVNLTFKAGFDLEGDPVALYRALCRKQASAYGALIHAGDHWVLSRSPELFVSLTGDRLAARPMKGTAKRGLSLADDAAGRAALAADIKNRAENLMIVDLLRNDLARISEVGSVQVTDLFTVETYRHLHTMTSGIEARLKSGLSRRDIIAGLFPCGSITGAPKIRAMEVIDAVETEPRGLYTGSIGWFAPDGDFCLNVAIRTAVIGPDGAGEIGIGGGIVADSQCENEYAEALLKMQFLSDKAEPVCLIETMLWTRDEGIYLLGRHLDRLSTSARYFAIPFDEAILRARIEEWARAAPGDRYRVRLTLHETDGLDLAATELPSPPDAPAPFRFAIAPERLHSENLWQAHKTTNRAFYDTPRQIAHAARGVDEVVFLNERGEIAEGSITTVFVESGSTLLTPPLSVGILPGTLRAELLATGRAKEAVLTLDDLECATAIYLGNSVRGLMRAQWVRG
ncbi:aminodeoxychorismate synthase component I [Pelagibacterium xiamenense]|uniref:aminodeoxychorismate synthase component I n=1 Tax=Pelagibacterium xiamenense TaxID=2901140 RepID=UPI001E61D071|nr:aminodeoxychorismate synthase component I [Pelagibacterium xiamenense]MCD7059727.1 aminodeoxychorismate synthase component I [Pelagibacterium xiamenense]